MIQDVCNDILVSEPEEIVTCDASNIGAHIPGKENTAADSECRKVNFDSEWKLNRVTLRGLYIATDTA